MTKRRPIPAPVCLTAARAPLHAGADSDAGFIYGYTALHDAACKHNADLTRLLLAAGADPNRKNNAGDTPVHEAAERWRLNVLRRLLAAGGDPNIQGFKDYTPLHWATIAAHNSVEVLELLLAAGADVTILNSSRKSPLDVARYRRDWWHPPPPAAGKIVELLETAVARTTKKRPADQVRRAPLPTTENRTGAETG